MVKAIVFGMLVSLCAASSAYAAPDAHRAEVAAAKPHAKKPSKPVDCARVTAVRFDDGFTVRVMSTREANACRQSGETYVIKGAKSRFWLETFDASGAHVTQETRVYENETSAVNAAHEFAKASK